MAYFSFTHFNKANNFFQVSSKQTHNVLSPGKQRYKTPWAKSDRTQKALDNSGPNGSKSNENAFVAAMSLRVSSFASVKNERMMEDDDDVSWVPNAKEIVPPRPPPPLSG